MFKLVGHIRSAAAVAAILAALTATGFAGGQKPQDTSTQVVAAAKPGTGTGGTAPSGPYFQTQLSIDLNQTFVGTATFTVPAGKELVIEYVSASGNVPPGESMMYSVTTGSVQHFIPAVQQVFDSSVVFFIAGQQTRIYADPGSTVTVGVLRTGIERDASANISISGTLIDPQQ